MERDPGPVVGRWCAASLAIALALLCAVWAVAKLSTPDIRAALLPHALPELVAPFLPLAAWMSTSRRGDWHELLAATLVTVLLATPLLVAAAFVEVFVSPGVLRGLAG